MHHILSLGAKLRQEVCLWGPAQGRRKYGTLCDIGRKTATSCRGFKVGPDLNIRIFKGDLLEMRNVEKTVGKLIDNANISIISSIDDEGFPNTKAMLPPRKREGIKEIYFSTNTSSMRVKQYIQNPKACVYFYDKRFFRGVMLKGTMEVLQDVTYREMIWRDGDEKYYSQGVNDPDYCVLKFTSQSGRYYSNFKSENFGID